MDIAFAASDGVDSTLGIRVSASAAEGAEAVEATEAAEPAEAEVPAMLKEETDLVDDGARYDALALGEVAEVGTADDGGTDTGEPRRCAG